MIVDVHVHLGYDYTFDEDFTRDDLLVKMETHDVDVQIVQPGSCHDLESVREQHDDIAALCREHPGRFFGMANPNPHLRDGQYHGEIDRCVENHGFISVKLNTIAHGVNPGTGAGRRAFEAARRHRMPIMVHTGSGVPFAGPVNLLSMAREYGDVTIIMAHCGQMIFANEASAVLEGCENVFGDTSWTPGFMIKNWLRQFGPRFMLGSDHADNLSTELAKIRTVGLTREEQESVLGGTSAHVFGLQENR
jgi:predicted TIM-barrel fold metal-dependent hydrolase